MTSTCTWAFDHERFYNRPIHQPTIALFRPWTCSSVSMHAAEMRMCSDHSTHKMTWNWTASLFLHVSKLLGRTMQTVSYMCQIPCCMQTNVEPLKNWIHQVQTIVQWLCFHSVDAYVPQQPVLSHKNKIKSTISITLVNCNVNLAVNKDNNKQQRSTFPISKFCLISI